MGVRSTLPFLRYALLTLLVTSAISAPAGTNTPFVDMIIADVRSLPPTGFTKVGDLPGDQPITLELNLFGRDFSGLEQQLYAVSTPKSSSYGKYLSQADVVSYAKPTDEALRGVNAWLSQNGVQSQSISPAGDRLQFTLPASKANQMFQATFAKFLHTETGTFSFQTLSYSIPAALKSAIQSVEPTTSFPNPTPPTAPSPLVQSSISARQASCSTHVTPACIQAQYHLPKTRSTNQKNVLGVPGFLKEYANSADLNTFLAKYRSDLNPRPSFVTSLIDGGQNPQDPSKAGVEANLDIQYTVGLVNGAPVNFISSGKANVNGFINVVNHWIGQKKPPTVVSISYGFNENQVSKGSSDALCQAFARLGARGTSVLIASGDGGVAGSRPNKTCTTFVPTLPANCPYITAVGATQGNPTETGADLSAGGFSNYYARPLYQYIEVEGYLAQLGSTYKGRYNVSGRAYPDVSAQGANLVIVKGGQEHRVDGTSASAPIFASVISLLNERLLGMGRQPLGFLNPLIYLFPEIFNDITSGHNPSCGTNGFPAKKGWDPVTGLGTPDFDKFAAAILAF